MCIMCVSAVTIASILSPASGTEIPVMVNEKKVQSY